MNAGNDDRRLQELGGRWAPRWRVWRSRNEFGMPGSWCATYRPEAGELGQTLVESTPEALEAALQAAKTGPRPKLEPLPEGGFVGPACTFIPAFDPVAGEPVFEYLYVTVAKRILRGIAAIGAKPGHRLPSLAELATAFAVSRATVRQAVKLLEERDLAVCMRGRGIFVGRRVADLPTVAGGNGHVPDLLALGAAVDAKPHVPAGEW